MNRIKQVEETYGKVSRGIQLRKQELLANQPDAPTVQAATLFKKPQPSASRNAYPSQDALTIPVATFFEKPLTACDIGRYKIRNIRNDPKPAPTPVLNLKSTSVKPYLDDSTSIDDHQPVPNSFTSEIRDKSECIPECLTGPAPPAHLGTPGIVQALLTSAPSEAYEPSREEPGKPPELVNIFSACVDGDTDAQLSDYPTSRQEKIAGQIVTPKEYVVPKKIITPEEVPSNTRVFNPCLVKEIKDPYIHSIPKLISLPGALFDCAVKFSNHHPHYKEKLGMTESAYKTSLLRPTPQLLSPPGASSDSIVKVMKPLHDLSEASTNHLATYHPHYKEKPGMTESAHKTFLLRPPPKLLSLPGASFDYVVEFATHHPHYKDKLVGNPTQLLCTLQIIYVS